MKLDLDRDQDVNGCPVDVAWNESPFADGGDRRVIEAGVERTGHPHWIDARWRFNREWMPALVQRERQH